MLQSSMANYTHGLWRILLWLAAHNSAQLKYYNGHLSSCAPVHSSELQSHIAQHTPTMVFYLCFSLSLSPRRCFIRFLGAEKNRCDLIALLPANLWAFEQATRISYTIQHNSRHFVVHRWQAMTKHLTTPD